MYRFHWIHNFGYFNRKLLRFIYDLIEILIIGSVIFFEKFYIVIFIIDLLVHRKKIAVITTD